jgi:hypothetical protein
MNKSHLHNMPDFPALFTDARFIGAVMYLRKHISPKSSPAQGPDQLIHKGGRIEGWLECIDALEALAYPDAAPPKEDTQKPLYT